jgi:hypothetical protein
MNDNGMNDKEPMNCEEFEIVGLDFECEGCGDEEGAQRALQHARLCAKCAALQSSWSVARLELAALGAAVRDVAVPARVETRVLQQFRLKHQSRRDRRTIKMAMWALAAAAVIVFTMGVWSLHQWRLRSIAKTMPPSSLQGGASATPATLAASADGAAADSSETLSASNISGNGEGDFTQLPGATFSGADDGTIVRLGMQRASLAGLGLPVNEEAAGDWIQVDVLVADDGSPQAVRLPQ